MALNPNMTLANKFSNLFPVINSFPLFLIDEQFKENKSIGEKSDSTYFLNNVNEKQKLLFKIKEYKKRGRNLLFIITKLLIIVTGKFKFIS